MRLFTILDDIEYVGDNFCETKNVLSVLRMVGYLLTLLKVFVPIIIIIWGTLKMYNVVASGTTDSLKKQWKNLVYRIIIGVCIFFVPTIVDAVLKNFISEDAMKCEVCVLKPFSCNPSDSSTIKKDEVTTPTEWANPKCENRRESQTMCESAPNNACYWDEDEEEGNRCKYRRQTDSCADKCSAYDSTSDAYFHCIDGCITASQISTPASVSFESDSWSTIAANVRSGNTNKYNVGDTKEVNLGDLGTHTVRISNMSESTNGETSETACGFVVEFADIITTHQFNSTATNVGGWRDSELRTYINETIYNALPSELQNVITTTKVISGHGSTSGETNFETLDKLYLLSAHEVWEKGKNESIAIVLYDASYSTTKQLDYYKNEKLTTDLYDNDVAIKQYNGSNSHWWLRSVSSADIRHIFTAQTNGTCTDFQDAIYASIGVSPAFRIA